MGETSESRQLLARRLRELREQQWRDVKVTQAHLARAFSVDRSVSVPLISSWESGTNPKIPPIPRLEAYATFFASTRSMDGGVPRLLRDAELTEMEREVKDDLSKELLRLRAAALGETAPPSVASHPPLSVREEEEENIASLSSGYWRFADGRPITILCALVPDEMRSRIPYSDPEDPDYVALYSYADLDAFVELHGHIRAANPGSHVFFRTTDQLSSDDYTTHLVSLGGVDWNKATSSLLARLSLPVRQVAEWSRPDGQYFEVVSGSAPERYRPVVDEVRDRKILREDVALFGRARNPFNRTRTVSVCSGMYARGTFGAVRALTDTRFRDRNTRYIRERFGDCDAFCILTKVTVENGVPLTPDWTLPENRLFEWMRDSSD